MSSRSRRPSTVACGGPANGASAASARSTVSSRQPPSAQPSQFSSARFAFVAHVARELAPARIDDEARELACDVRHSILSPAAFTTCAHFAISALMNAAKFCGVPPTPSAPMMVKTLFHVRQRERSDDRGMQFGHDRLRRAGGHEQSVPADDLVALAGPLRRASAAPAASGERLSAGDRERAQLAGLRERQRARDVFEHELDLAADEIGERRPAALVRHVRHLQRRPSS